MNHPVVVIGPQFCSGYPVDLIIERTMITLPEGYFGVTDVNGKIMFKFKGIIISLGERRRVLLDAAGNPIVTSQLKNLMSWRGRWQVFRGESTDKKDLIFSVRGSSILQLRLKMKLEVYLASNTREDVCDFIIEGSWFKSSCVIYAGRSRNIVAQMHRNQSVLLGKDSFGVTVYPNVDYAFVVALVLLLEEINMDWKYYSSRS